MRAPRHPLGFEECRTARQPCFIRLSCGAASAQGKGAPGDGDALPLLFDQHSAHYYWAIVPHAIRSPAFPAGSVFMSSALA